MIKKIMSILIILVVILCTSNGYAVVYNAKVTIVVLGEDGHPIEGAKVGIGFDDNRSNSKENSVIGETDLNGKFVGTETTTSGYLGFNVTKEGYYESIGNYQYEHLALLRWEPWNPELIIVLRKIENAVSMYARKVRKQIPLAKKEIGFDFLRGDWVAPHGQGQIADITIILETEDTGMDNFEHNVNVKFIGESNGYYIVHENIADGSMYKLPRQAKADMFNKSIAISWKGIKRGSKLTWDKNRHYIFRIRSENENGKLIKAMYGKILSDIALRSNRKTGGMPSIELIYYVNPDYTRNLEFDPKRNLFGLLPENERVTNP